jgi:hypothetical protein
MSDNKPKNGVAKWIDSSVIIFFFAGILLFLLLSGTLNSGYHFTDDHEMIDIQNDLQNNSFVVTTENWIKRDLNIRFRPVYYMHRIAEVKIFGVDFQTLSFYNGILIACAFFFFYLGARKLSFSILESFLLVLLTFVGAQSAIWWRLGPNETIGMFFLGLSFFFLGRCVARKNYTLDSILFNTFLVLASLSKESFVLIIPAFAVFKTWNESRIFHITIKNSIKNNYVLIATIFIMIGEIWFIVFSIGSNQIGYAGTSSGIKELVLGISQIISREDMLWPWMKLIVSSLVVFWISFFSLQYGWKENLRHRIFSIAIPFTFFILVLFPNLYLYARSGMVAHYFLPTTLGLSFLVVSLVKNTKTVILKAVIFLFCLFFLRASFNSVIITAQSFAQEGVQTNEFLSFAESAAKSSSKVLLAADPVTGFEFTAAVRTHLATKGINNVFGYPIARNYQSEFERTLKTGWEKWFENKMISDMDGEPDVIMTIYRKREENLFNDLKISEKNYQNILDPSNPQEVYVRR